MTKEKMATEIMYKRSQGQKVYQGIAIEIHINALLSCRTKYELAIEYIETIEKPTTLAKY